MSNRYDCIIVGAGFAGLTAARKLKQENLRVLLLEARSRVGGRTESGQLAGITIDLGGMWLGPTQERLAALADSYQVRTYRTWLPGEAKICLSDKPRRVPEESLEYALPEEALPDFEKIVVTMEELAASVDPQAPWTHPDAEYLDSHTVESWMSTQITHPDVRTFVRLVCQAIFCAETAQLSMLFFLFYLRSAGGLGVLMAQGEGGAQNFLFEGSLHQIALRLGQEVADSVQLSSPVSSIRQTEDGVEISAGGLEYAARFAIVAAPPGPTNQIEFVPSLPPKKKGLLRRQPMGSCIKCWIAYDRPFWRDQGLNGLVLNTAAPFTPLMDVTPPDAGVGLLAGFFDADSAANWTSCTPEERKTAVLEELVSQFGPEAAVPIDFVERDWTAETYSEGCYGAFMGPGTMTRYGSVIREPIGRLHWAGTETSEVWSGYVEGAIHSGERAAAEVLQRLRQE